MAGIVFLRTERLEEIVGFYEREAGAAVWLRQAECVILKHGNLLLGFCRGERAETEGVLTFFLPRREQVDEAYGRLRDRARGAPAENPRYRIYHFYAADPEGRSVEFQTFLHPLPPHEDGAEMLARRRSVRRFAPETVPEDVLARVFDLCAFAPSSRNRQPCYYVLARRPGLIADLAAVRGDPSAPIGRAPLAVAVCVESARTVRPEHDGAIAACYLLLSARIHGLGTCWVTDMDRPEVKAALGVPEADRVTMITPLGYPAEDPPVPPRRDRSRLVREAP